MAVRVLLQVTGSEVVGRCKSFAFYCVKPKLCCILFCAEANLLWPSGAGREAGRKEAMLLHMPNRKCSSATGNNLHADDVGLRGALARTVLQIFNIL